MQASVGNLRVELESSATEDLLRLEAGLRQQLAVVLADWLGAYSGTSPERIRREHFNLVVELRRLLLSPDESPRRGGV